LARWEIQCGDVQHASPGKSSGQVAEVHRHEPSTFRYANAFRSSSLTTVSDTNPRMA